MRSALNRDRWVASSTAGSKRLWVRCVSVMVAAVAGVMLFAPAAVQAQADKPKVLLYTGTMGFRHAEAIDAGAPVLKAALEGIGYQVDWKDWEEK